MARIATLLLRIGATGATQNALAVIDDLARVQVEVDALEARLRARAAAMRAA